MNLNDTALKSQKLLMPDSLVSAVDDANTESECLVVIRGEQSGVKLEIAGKPVFSIGTDFSNDVVLRSREATPVKLIIESQQGRRRILLKEGLVSAGDVQLPLEQWVELDSGMPVSFADVTFLIKGPVSVEQTDIEHTSVSSASGAKRLLAIAALVAGIALFAVLGAQELRIADRADSAPSLTLEQRIADLNLHDLEIINDDAGIRPAIVQGRVKVSDDFRRLQQMLKTQIPTVSLDVQVDSDIADALHDIFRNHGIEAKIAVVGKGHVRVETEGVDEPTMITIEQAVSADLPMLARLDIANTPPDEPEAEKTFHLDPEKEVEAVVEGAVSYVITRDQARYFVGATLPSGHLIKSIEKGAVVMSLAGELTQLEF